MSIKGFKVNNQTEKYDYEALDNLPDIDYSCAIPVYTPLSSSIHPSGTASGVTYTWNSSTGAYSITGDATAGTSVFNIYSNGSGFIPGIVPGGKYYIHYKGSQSDGKNVSTHMRILWFKNGISSTDTNVVEYLYKDTIVKVPSDATGMLFGFRVLKGKVFSSAETISDIAILSLPKIKDESFFDSSSDGFHLSTHNFHTVQNVEEFLRSNDSCVAHDTADNIQSVLSSTADFPFTLSATGTTNYFMIKYVYGDGEAYMFLQRYNAMEVYAGYQRLQGSSFSSSTQGYHWYRLKDPRGNAKSLKVLAIGNSYTQDSLTYMPYILDHIGCPIDLTLGITYYGGATLNQQKSFFENDTNIQYDKKVPDSIAWSVSTKTIKQVLADEAWDIILLTQASMSQGDWSTFSNLEAFITGLANYHRAVHSNSANVRLRFGWLMPQRRLSMVDTITLPMVLDCIDKVLSRTSCEFVIPCGMAIENARGTELNDLGDGGGLTAESNGHLQEGLPILLSGYTAALKILDLLGMTDYGIMGDSLTVTADMVSSSNWNIPGQNGTCIVPANYDRARLIAQKCAVMAVKYPYKVSKITYLADIATWNDPYSDKDLVESTKRSSINTDKIAVQAYSDFTLLSKRWDANMALGDSSALGHTQNFKIIPGSDYYIGTIGYVNNGVMGCFLNFNETPLQPLLNSDCSEFSYPPVTDNPNTDFTQFAKLYKFTAPDDAYYLSLNWTLTTSEHWKFFFSNIPMFREGNSGDLIVYENDPMRHKKNKKLCVVGPSYAMIDRRKQANYGNKYVVGFQEYLYPFYDSVTTFGYSGGTWGQMRDDTYISIYSGIVTGYGASVLPKDFTPYDEVLLIGCNPNGFFTTPRQEEGTAGTFDTNTSDVSTFMGGLRGVVEYILNQKPNMKIYLSNFWHGVSITATYKETCENLNAEMLKLANLFGLQYIDMYNGTPFNKWNYTVQNTIYTYDGSHPNNAGMREIADVLVRNMI